MKTLNDAFRHTLEDMFYAENALVKALPVMADAASNKTLKAAIKEHLEETKRQVKTLKEVFASIEQKPVGNKCDAIEGLIKETKGIIDEADGPVALNACILAAAQAVEHYEIARYGSLREWAKVLGHAQAHDLLTSILDEEKAANSKLTNLAVSAVNQVR